MFRISKIYDTDTDINHNLVEQVQAIIREQFSGLGEQTISKLPNQLGDPMRHRFRSVLLVAQDRNSVIGFALLLHAPDLKFCYLDLISAGKGITSRGIGGALYQRVREEAASLGVIGIFLECLPDDPALSPDASTRRQNAARLRFYEQYGALPIINTLYETPVTEGDSDPPYLVFDPLGQPAGQLDRAGARKIVRAILERKYGDHCPPEYISKVVSSIKDDPVQRRTPRYLKSAADAADHAVLRHPPVALVVNDRHDIHHVRDQGYVESPVRIKSILKELDRSNLFQTHKVQHFPQRYILAVHDKDYVSYLKKACANVPSGKSIYPYVFPIRNRARPPREYPLRAGYYCMDTFTPLNQNAYLAAVRAVDCALTATRCVLDGAPIAYALVRPPGHHAERRAFGGFCYFNSAAVAAQELSTLGKVALLDIDYHHGNGAQDIFYQRADVLTVSLHGHPRHTYPYFSGFADETGEGAGLGFNLNLPLAENLDGPTYLKSLAEACRRIEAFAPDFLVLALGLDTAKGDPTGSFLLGASDFQANGRRIAELGLPTVVVQEGGYRTRTLGVNARHFFTGLAGAWQPRDARPRRSRKP